MKQFKTTTGLWHRRRLLCINIYTVARCINALFTGTEFCERRQIMEYDNLIVTTQMAVTLPADLEPFEWIICFAKYLWCVYFGLCFKWGNDRLRNVPPIISQNRNLYKPCTYNNLCLYNILSCMLLHREYNQL